MALQEAEARGIFQQLLLAVDYCHKMGVASRDIKLENVLLSGRRAPFTMKLTDFGFCKRDCDSIPTTMCGTLGYMGEFLRASPRHCQGFRHCKRGRRRRGFLFDL